MRTDFYPFEAALYHLLQVDRQTPWPVPTGQWAAILSLTGREQVEPLVYAAIRTSVAAAPESVRLALERSHAHAGAANTEAYAQLAAVLRALRPAGVSAVLLKGAALSRFIYREQALRPFGDLDLLVRPQDVEAAHDALRSAGYTIAGERPSAADLAWRQARAYTDPAGRKIPVDLHWRYAGYPLLIGASPGVFARAHPVEVDGERALIPAPEDMLVALGVQFARDLWYGNPRLRYLRDAAEVVRRHSVAWPLLEETVRETPLARAPLYVALEAARDLLGAGVSQEALRALSPPGHRWLQDYLVTRICRGVLRQDRPADALLQIALMRWLDAPSVVAYVRWLSGLFFVPRELAASRRRWLRGFWARRPPGADRDG